MAYPKPEPGLVIGYSFLWREQADRGQDEGEKDRPCAIVMTAEDDQGDTVIIVFPVTHSPPEIPALAVEIPAATKARLGLDDQLSWIIVTEANRFIWPGPDRAVTPRPSPMACSRRASSHRFATHSRAPSSSASLGR